MWIKALSIGLLALTCVVTSSCALRRPMPQTDTTANIAPTTQLLFYSKALRLATPAQRQAMLASARERYARQPTAAAAARLALAYGQPGHQGYAPENCWRYAHKALLLDTAHWDPAATAYLKQIKTLCTDNAEVRDTLTALRKKYRHSHQQLTQAREKLQALTQLETELAP